MEGAGPFGAPPAQQQQEQPAWQPVQAPQPQQPGQEQQPAPQQQSQQQPQQPGGEGESAEAAAERQKHEDELCDKAAAVRVRGGRWATGASGCVGGESGAWMRRAHPLQHACIYACMHAAPVLPAPAHTHCPQLHQPHQRR